MSEDGVDVSKRRFLTGSVAVLGGIGAAFAAVPFLASFQPSARTKAIGSPIQIDLSHLAPGQRVIEKWRGKPVWIIHRTSEMLAALKDAPADELRDPESMESIQPPYAKNVIRSIKDQYLVLLGVCTHLSCSPQFIPEPKAEGLGGEWRGGFFCSCHGSKFDLAGRVFKGVPAPTNLEVPPHRYQGDHLLVIGEDEKVGGRT